MEDAGDKLRHYKADLPSWDWRNLNMSIPSSGGYAPPGTEPISKYTNLERIREMEGAMEALQSRMESLEADLEIAKTGLLAGINRETGRLAEMGLSWEEIREGWAYIEADFQREYRIDLAAEISHSFKHGGGLSWRKFLVLLSGLSSQSTWVAWRANYKPQPRPSMGFVNAR